MVSYHVNEKVHYKRKLRMYKILMQKSITKIEKIDNARLRSVRPKDNLPEVDPPENGSRSAREWKSIRPRMGVDPPENGSRSAREWKSIRPTNKQCIKLQRLSCYSIFKFS